MIELIRTSTLTSYSLRSKSTSAGQTHVANDSDETEEGRQAWFRSMWEGDSHEPEEQEEVADNDADGEDDFGDDFDDFAEGAEGDEDFGDFDEAGDDEPVTAQPAPSQLPPAPDILKGLVSSIPSLIHNTLASFLPLHRIVNSQLISVPL